MEQLNNVFSTKPELMHLVHYVIKTPAATIVWQQRYAINAEVENFCSDMESKSNEYLMTSYG